MLITVKVHYNGQSTLLLYCCEDVKSDRSGDTVPLIVENGTHTFILSIKSYFYIVLVYTILLS